MFYNCIIDFIKYIFNYTNNWSKPNTINDSLYYNQLISKNEISKLKLKHIKASKKSNLCFSADLPDTNKILEILEKIGKYIVICKIHYDIIEKDEDFIKKLILMADKHNFLIMEDRKFVDISSIVEKQYSKFANWVDLVTVHGSVSTETLSVLSGALIVANMSNNNYDFTQRSIKLARENPDSVVGFISQYKISCEDLVTMTPGVALTSKAIDDQKYRDPASIETDFIIVGRAIYKAKDPEKVVQELLKY